MDGNTVLAMGSSDEIADDEDANPPSQLRIAGGNALLDQSLQISLATKAVRSVAFLRRSSATSVGRLHRARRMKVRGDLALLCAAHSDAAMYSAAAAIELKAIGDVQWHAGALVTWVAAIHLTSDANVLRESLMCTPVVVPRADSDVGTGPSHPSFLMSKEHAETIDSSEHSFARCELRVRGHESEDDVARSRVRSWMMRCIRAAGAEAIKMLRKQSSLSPLAIELALTLARMHVVAGDKRRAMNTLEMTPAIIEDGAISSFELARTSQAISLICQHANLPRKGALYATVSSRASRDLCSYACVQLSARLALQCVYTSGWTRVSKLAASETASAAKLRGDVDGTADVSAHLLRHHANLKQLEALHDGSRGITTSVLDVTTKVAEIHYSDRCTVTTSEEQQRDVLEKAEVLSAELPDDAAWDQSDPICTNAFRHRAAHLCGCFLNADVQSHKLASGLTHKTSRVHGRSSGRTQPATSQPFLWSPFNEGEVPVANSCGHAVWILGERAVVKVLVKNTLLAPMYVHSARLVCVGGRCICHESLSHPNKMHNPQLVSADTDVELALQVTPLEVGAIRIRGVQLRTSLYVTTNTVLLKQAFCAVRCEKHPVSLSKDQSPQEAFYMARLNEQTEVRPDGETPCCLLPRVCEPQPKCSSLLKFVPYRGLMCTPTAKASKSVQRICRPGEHIMLALTFTNSSTIAPNDLEVQARCNGGRMRQALFALCTAAYTHDAENSTTAALSNLLRRASAMPVSLVCEVCKAAKHFGGGCVSTWYSCDTSLQRLEEAVFTLCPAHGVATQRCELRVRDDSACEVKIDVRNLCDATVVLGFGSQRILMRANECCLTLTQQQSSPSVTREVDAALAPIRWRIEGSRDGHLDGFGTLPSPQ